MGLWIRKSWVWISVLSVGYGGTSLSCTGIHRWKSVSFHCWAVINLVCEDEQWGGGHSTPTPPILGHQELRVKWDEQWGGRQPTPPHPPLVIRSWELSEMSNDEEDTPPTPLVIRSWELSEMSLSTSWIKIFILQCQHTDTPGVQLVDYVTSLGNIFFFFFFFCFLF